MASEMQYPLDKVGWLRELGEEEAQNPECKRGLESLNCLLTIKSLVQPGSSMGLWEQAGEPVGYTVRSSSPPAASELSPTP